MGGSPSLKISALFISIIRSGNRHCICIITKLIITMLIIPLVNSYHLFVFYYRGFTDNNRKGNVINDLIVFSKIKLWL